MSTRGLTYSLARISLAPTWPSIGTESGGLQLLERLPVGLTDLPQPILCRATAARMTQMSHGRPVGDCCGITNIQMTSNVSFRVIKHHE